MSRSESSHKPTKNPERKGVTWTNTPISNPPMRLHPMHRPSYHTLPNLESSLSQLRDSNPPPRHGMRQVFRADRRLGLKINGHASTRSIAYNQRDILREIRLPVHLAHIQAHTARRARARAWVVDGTTDWWLGDRQDAHAAVYGVGDGCCARNCRAVARWKEAACGREEGDGIVACRVRSAGCGGVGKRRV